MDSEVSFGAWLRRRRRTLDLTQDALARRMSCARITIQKIEADERRPSRDFAVLLAEHLAIPPAERDTFLRAARSVLAVEQLADPDHLATTRSDFQPVSGEHVPIITGNLPVYMPPCIGRERELARIGVLIADPNCRLVTLTGMGGVGKTRLAIAAAATHVAMFPGGAWFVSLMGVESDKLAAMAIADSLDIQPNPTLEPLEQLTVFLRNRQLLLILDNAEHIAPAVAMLLARLMGNAQGLKVIVTSRERLRMQGEWLIELEGLSYSDGDTVVERPGAVRLFTHYAHMARPDLVLDSQELSQVAHLCRLLEGLPLAIELAAAWVRILPCQAIAAQVTRGMDMAALAPRSLPERQRSLRAVFDYSYELLTTDERATLCGLSVFHNMFDLAAAQSVVGVSLELLASLLEKSLLRRNGARFDLHPLMRRYASERLAEVPNEQERMLARHARYYAELAYTVVTGDRSRESLVMLSLIYANLRAAWEWAVTHRVVAMVDQMIKSLIEVHGHSGMLREGVDVFGQAVLAFTSVEDVEPEVQRLVARLRVRQAVFYRNLAMYEQARHLVLQAIAIVDSPGERALCLKELGNIMWAQGIHHEARRYLEEALHLQKVLGDKPAEMIILSDLSMILHDLGEYEEAHRLCRIVSDYMNRSEHQRWSFLITEGRFGYVEFARGNYQAARRLMENVLTITIDTGGNHYYVHLHGFLALVLAALGEYATAEQLLREALGRARSSHYLLGITLTLNFLGAVLCRKGANAEARVLLEESLALCEAIENRTGIVYALVWLGEIACTTGDETGAEIHLRRALKVVVEMHTAPLMLDVLAGFAELAACRGQNLEALRLLALPLEHTATRAVTHERAEQIYARLASRLPDEQVAWALAEGRAGELMKVATGLLAGS